MLLELDVDYKLYIFVKDEGSPNPDKGHPTVVDSVLVNTKVNILEFYGTELTKILMKGQLNQYGLL